MPVANPCTLQFSTVTPGATAAIPFPPPLPKTKGPAQSSVTAGEATRIGPYWSSVSVVFEVMSMKPDEAAALPPTTSAPAATAAAIRLRFMVPPPFADQPRIHLGAHGPLTLRIGVLPRVAAGARAAQSHATASTPQSAKPQLRA